MAPTFSNAILHSILCSFVGLFWFWSLFYFFLYGGINVLHRFHLPSPTQPSCPQAPMLFYLHFGQKFETPKMQ